MVMMLRTGSDGPLVSLLDACAGALPDGPAHAPFRAALSSIDPTSPGSPVQGSPAPACFERALAQTGPPAARTIAAALAELRPALAFTQNPAYVAAPPDERFLAHYGYAVLVGPASGPPALIEHPGLALGVLVLDAETLYPLHLHPAHELYLPLGAARWSRGSGPLAPCPAGVPVVHVPDEPHATQTDGTPLAALYLWLGSLDVGATLVTPP
jgi:Dimethlysulfonioproprionate lyase